jgi:hypothetical protein
VVRLNVARVVCYSTFVRKRQELAKRESLEKMIWKNIFKKFGENLKGVLKKGGELSAKAVASIAKSLVKKVIIGGILIGIGTAVGFNFGVG